MKNIAQIIFGFSVACVLIAELAMIDWLRYLSKPLIMASLLFYYLVSSAAENRSKMMLLAMIFSLAGDVLLLNTKFFIPGLIVFLLAHLLYIFVYRQHQHEEFENVLMGLQRLRLAFPVILAGTGLIVILYPVLHDLKIPVIAYAAVLVLMVLTALFRFGRTTSASFWMVFIGAILFMISDSILAINKFLQPINIAGFWIMLTYSLAQLLIVKGLLRHPDNNSF